MQFGITMFATDRSMGVVELARAAEERGFDSLFLPEHSHIPATRKTPYPLGGELPEEYKRTVDPFVALGAAAAVTTRLRLGTGILPRRPARPHPHREGGRDPRRDLERTLRLRRGDWLE